MVKHVNVRFLLLVNGFEPLGRNECEHFVVVGNTHYSRVASKILPDDMNRVFGLRLISRIQHFFVTQ